jgi:tRNA dimethylallyltransferase
MCKVISIGGPTASGKTDLAIFIAKLFDIPILNYDSVQFYKGYDIGSAKSTSLELNGVKQLGIDILEPNEEANIYDFQQYARNIINNNPLTIMVGGSGLYCKSVLFDYELKGVPSRHQEYENISTSELYSRLINIDSEVRVDPLNRNRIIRYLELAENNVLRSSLERKDTLLYSTLFLYLDVDRQVLKNRLELRLDKMMENGFVEEVVKIKSKYPVKKAIGYSQINSYLSSEMSLDEAKEDIILKSMQYAKRQKTWYKNQFSSIMLDVLKPKYKEEAITKVISFLNKGVNNFFLVGLPASGKSSIGLALAKELDYTFIDLDDYIFNNFNFVLSNIKRLKQFRDLELLAIQILSRRSKTIISCGGGILDNPNSFDFLSKEVCIYLECDLEIIKSRLKLQNKRRIVLENSTIEELANVRIDKFEQVNSFKISNNGTIKDGSELLLKYIRSINEN